MSADRERGALLKALGLSFLASPLAALWAARSSGNSSRSRWLWRGIAALGTITLAALLLIPKLRWQVVTISWAGYCLVGGLIAFFCWSTKNQGSTPSGPDSSWGGKTLQAALPIVFLMPSLLVFARLLGWTIVGGALSRLHPRSIDPPTILSSLFFEAFWIAPCGILFAAIAYRRGRLGKTRDLLVAAVAWAWVLCLQEVFVLGSFGALRSQVIWEQGFSVGMAFQSFWLKTALVLAVVPVTSYLAWGGGRWWRRGLAVSALIAVAMVNLSILLGVQAQAQFVKARVLEREGKAREALSWYGRSLASNPDPMLASYLQHRIGLLNYKLGDVQLARDAFREVLTVQNANDDLVDQSNYYLDRLTVGSEGQRVVLDSVDVQIEAQRDYCAPNTLGLVFSHWGKSLSVREIGEQASRIGGGTLMSGMQFLVEGNDLEMFFRPFATLDDLRWLVDRGLPAVVFTPRHVLSVFGYDDRLGTVVAFDTAKWDIWVDRPYHEFLNDWGQESFLLGVILPKENTISEENALPQVKAARARYDQPVSKAAWHHWMAVEEGYGKQRHRYLQKSILADPTYFPAALELMKLGRGHGDWSQKREDTFPWVSIVADVDRVVESAEEILVREHAPIEELGPDLARWYLETGQEDAVLEIGTEMSRRESLDSAGDIVGQAAVRKKQWEKAVFMVQEAGDNATPEGLLGLFEAQIELGHEDAAAATMLEIIDDVSGDRLESLVEQAEALAGGQGPAFLETVYSHYLGSKPEDLKRQLRLAELSLQAVEDLSGDLRRERLQRARRAATRVLYLSSDSEEQNRAGEILEGLRSPVAPGSFAVEPDETGDNAPASSLEEARSELPIKGLVGAAAPLGDSVG